MRKALLCGLFAGVVGGAFGGSLDETGDRESRAAAWAFRQSNPESHFHLRDGRISRIYGRAFGSGATSAESAAQFVQNHAGVFGVEAENLSPGNGFDTALQQPVMFDTATGQYRFTLHYYRQSVAGVPVFRADLRLLVANRASFPLVWAGSALRDLGGFTLTAADVPVAPPMRGHDVVLANRAEVVNLTPAELVVWAGVDELNAPPQLAEVFFADNGLAGTEDFARWQFVTDAATGAILYEENQIVHTDITGTVTGNATEGTGADLCDDESATGLPYALVSSGGGQTYAGETGAFVLSNDGDDPITVESEIQGRYFVVFNQSGDNALLSRSVTPGEPVEFRHNEANSSETNRAEVNAYLHSNIVRDFALVQNPDYPTIDEETGFTVNVNIGQTCNAFYDGGAINFFRSGGGCANTAFSTVVYHEYGHHLVQTGGSGQRAYGEGMSDCVAMLIVDEPELAFGFQRNCNRGIRSGENNVDYPCSGEVHFCGTVLSGCVWETRQELAASNPENYLAILSPLVINSILLHSGSGIDPEITIDILTLDDDNGDLNDGSPHYTEIATGFGRHNMDAPPLPALSFELPDGVPTLLDPRGGTSFRFHVLPNHKDPAPGSLKLYYSVGGGEFTATDVDPNGGNEYVVAMPAVSCGRAVRFYFTAETTDNLTVSHPADAPVENYPAISGFAINPFLSDNFETNEGWTVENDGSLTDGAWERGTPVGGGDRGDPAADFDGSGRCFLTANRDGNSDVDGGTTYLISPPFDLTGRRVVVGYARWYDNSKGDSPYVDEMIVSVSADDGATWIETERVGPDGPEVEGGWYQSGFLVNDFVEPSGTVRVRFAVGDLGFGSVVEGGIDAFSLADIDCEPPLEPGDLNCDGGVDFDDIDPFVLALIDPAGYAEQYPDCDRNLGDVNGDGDVNFDDIDPFVELLTK